jgi:hypothetical protein
MRWGSHLGEISQVLFGAAHYSCDGSRLPTLLVAVKHAEALPLKVGRAVCQENGVHVGRVRFGGHCTQKQ